MRLALEAWLEARRAGHMVPVHCKRRRAISPEKWAKWIEESGCFEYERPQPKEERTDA